MRFFLLSVSLLLMLSPPVTAQRVDCTVQVNYEAVSTTHKDLLVDFEHDIRNYINNYEWGTNDPGEKIKCTISIFIQNAPAENKYTAQVFIGSQRPIFGTERNSAVVRLFDESWEFMYFKSRPINHSEYSFNDLTSFLDFYIFLIIGYDFDTYEPRGGTPYFQKAADIANLGQTSSAKGWEQKSSSFSRLQLINEIIGPKLAPIRNAMHTYHFAGLDSMAIQPARGQANVLRALTMIERARKQIDPRNLFVKTFFEAKNLEIADVFSTFPDPEIYARLSQIDPVHQATYEEYRNKKR
ncbi:MAG: DUF4835 family protein [Bacteroidota bacterium]